MVSQMPYIANLKSLRIGCRLSQAALARRANIDRATVSRCENGYSVMDIKCAAIEGAIKEEATRRGLAVELTISDGGKIGPFPKKKGRQIEDERLGP